MKRKCKLRGQMAGSVLLAMLAGCGGGGHPCPGTSAPPFVQGTYTVGNGQVTASTCTAALTDIVESFFSESCDYLVAQSGYGVTVTSCTNDRLTGCVDQASAITATVTEVQSIQGCTVGLVVTLSADAGAPTSDAQFVFDIHLAGTCPGAQPCVVTVATNWTAAVGDAAGAAAIGRPSFAESIAAVLQTR